MTNYAVTCVLCTAQCATTTANEFQSICPFDDVKKSVVSSLCPQMCTIFFCLFCSEWIQSQEWTNEWMNGMSLFRLFCAWMDVMNHRTRMTVALTRSWHGKIFGIFLFIFQWMSGDNEDFFRSIEVIDKNNFFYVTVWMEDAIQSSILRWFRLLAMT